MQYFVKSMASIARVGSKLAHRQINIEKCTKYLKELNTLKKLVDKLKYHRVSQDDKPEEDRFNSVEV